ncbi:MAG: ribosome-associated translation inhibitor RaiA [bacterium]|nr:ribosome-associated translation inhibitor RaiA [bacterium]
MKLHIKTTNLKLTPAIEEFINQKINRDMAKFIKRLDEKGAAEIFVEIARTSRHHKQGDIFRAEADLRLPGKVLRAEAEEWNIRVAIDQVKDELQREIKKYKERQATKFKKGARKIKTEILGE